MRLLDRYIKETNYWIRFELGLVELKGKYYGKKYFDEIYHRAKIIFDDAFAKNDDVLIVVRTINSVKNNRIKVPNIKRFIKNKKLIRGLKCETKPFEYDMDDMEDSQMETKEYSLKLRKDDLRLSFLIQLIGNEDFSFKPRIDGSVYVFNLTKETLFHMYDDRGCDIYGLDKENLLPIYHKHRKWILDNNRIQIDHLFNQGLFNMSETPEERNQRLQINRKKIKETEINLYEDNTCTITHELEIPIEFLEVCLSELSQTGFDIRTEPKTSDYIVLKATKIEALALIDYQTELMSLYSKKYKAKYNSWSAIRV